MLEGATILVFADDWGVHPSSAQHLIRRFLGKNRVIWFNTTGLRPPRASLYDVRKLVRKAKNWTGHLAARLSLQDRKTQELSPEVHDIALLPLQWGTYARKINAWILNRAVKRCLSDSPSSQSTFIVSTLPLTADLVGTVPGATFIYYLVDDYASWPGLTGKMIRQMDLEQARAADRIVAASQALVELHQTITNRIDYLPHGADVEHFALAREIRGARIREGAKPIADVIFFGALDERIDQEMLNATVQARPGIRFLCIGPETGSKDRLASAPNLQRCLPIPIGEVPNLLGQCQVAFLPYVQSDLGQRLAPLKALEALAAGLPIVATEIPELRRLTEGVVLGKALEDILAGLDRALDGNISIPSLEALADHTWENRAERLSIIMISARALRVKS